MKFLPGLLKALSYVPIAVAGAEGIITEAGAGASKKQLAIDSAMTAAGITAIAMPGQSQQIQQVATALGPSVDFWVSVFNKNFWKPAVPGTSSSSS